MRVRPSSQTVKFSKKNFFWLIGIQVAAVALAWPFFSWQGLIAFFVLYFLTGFIGVTFGFHRLLTHRAFRAHPWLERFAALCGTLACQGGAVSWVAQHRLHHAFSDTDQDPHNAKRGFWYCHIGYLFMRRGDIDDFEEAIHYCPDMAKRTDLIWMEKHQLSLQIALAALLALIGGLIGPASGFDWSMAGSLVVWGIFVRMAWVYNATFFVNSAAHMWGSQPNKTGDTSRNNWWVALLSGGEGWHNNHHAQPRSARHGWTWWQFDLTWQLIRLFARLKLVSHIRLPVHRGGESTATLSSLDEAA